MGMRRAWLPTCMAALLLAVCARPGFAAMTTLQQMRADQKIADVHSIGVIALAGQHVAVQTTGLTVFQNSLRYTPDTNWQLDPVIAADIVKALAPRFNAVAIALPPDTIQKLPHAAFSSEDSEIADVAHKVPGVPDVDAYLLVEGSGCNTGSKQFPDTAFVLLSGSAFGGTSPYTECVGMGTALIDAKSGSTIYFGLWLGPPTSISGKDPWGNEPSRHLPAGLSPPPENAPLTPEQSATLRADFLSLAESGVVPSLKRIRLLPRDAGTEAIKK